MRPDIKQDFSRFLNAVPGRLHMAAHSHHYWPDVTFDAHMAAWMEAALHADDKWSHIFGHVMPEARRGIARILNLPDPSTLVFAQNTHEFVLRLMSCLPTNRAPRILCTDSEFHSFARQIHRLEEDMLVSVTRIPTEPFESFTARFCEAAGNEFDMVFFSHVFFNSGFMTEPLADIVAAVKNEDTLVVIDGYHGFMAVPTDFSALAARAFYLGGGYKYAMAGEGACFMHCPPGYGARPRNTGWFAGFGALQDTPQNIVGYGADASRFAGATADVSGLYRLNAIFRWLESRSLTVTDIHRHAHRLQNLFVNGLAGGRLQAAQLAVSIDDPRRGNFLTFRTDEAGEICSILKENNIITDRRGDCLRFGFGPYHDAEDMAYLTGAIAKYVG